VNKESQGNKGENIFRREKEHQESQKRDKTDEKCGGIKRQQNKLENSL
jgi:hypothetical protein